MLIKKEHLHSRTNWRKDSTWTLIKKKKIHRCAQLYAGCSSHLLVNTARTARAVHFWAALWNMLAPSFKGSIAQLIWSDLCPVCTALCFFFLSLFSKTSKFAGIMIPPPLLSLVSGPGGGTVVNAWWLTDSHGPDSGSDWSSPCSSHMAQSTLACVPFLFFPLLFPSVVQNTRSGFWALSLASSLTRLGSKWKSAVYFPRMAGEEKNTLSSCAWYSNDLVSGANFVRSLFFGRYHT